MAPRHPLGLRALVGLHRPHGERRRGPLLPPLGPYHTAAAAGAPTAAAAAAAAKGRDRDSKAAAAAAATAILLAPLAPLGADGRGVQRPEELPVGEVGALLRVDPQARLQGACQIGRARRDRVPHLVQAHFLVFPDQPGQFLPHRRGQHDRIPKIDDHRAVFAAALARAFEHHVVRVHVHVDHSLQPHARKRLLDTPVQAHRRGTLLQVPPQGDPADDGLHGDEADAVLGVHPGPIQPGHRRAAPGQLTLNHGLALDAAHVVGPIGVVLRARDDLEQDAGAGGQVAVGAAGHHLAAAVQKLLAVPRGVSLARLEHHAVRAALAHPLDRRATQPVLQQIRQPRLRDLARGGVHLSVGSEQRGVHKSVCGVHVLHAVAPCQCLLVGAGAGLLLPLATVHHGLGQQNNLRMFSGCSQVPEKDNPPNPLEMRRTLNDVAKTRRRPCPTSERRRATRWDVSTRE